MAYNRNRKMNAGRKASSRPNFRKAAPSQTPRMQQMGKTNRVQTVDYMGATFRVSMNPMRPGSGTFTLVRGNLNGVKIPGGVKPGNEYMGWPGEKPDDGGNESDCFSRNSIVKLENGNNISISKLKIGDKVKTINKNGKTEYSEVYAWFHKSYEDYRDDYINVKTEDNTLTITPQHRIFVNDVDSPASDIKVGDTISGQKVTSVDSITAYGKYAPATKNGFIVVDGINCSCYAFYSHNFCHAMVNVLLKPLVKLVPSLGSWLGKDGINKFCAPFMKDRTIGRLITKLG